MAKMSACSCDKTLLLEYAIGDLGREERIQVEAQVRACRSCAQELEIHRMLAADLRALPTPELPSGLEEILIRSALEAGRRGRVRAARSSFAWTPVLCTAAGLAIVAILVLILNPSNLARTGAAFDPVGPDGVGRGATVFDELLQLYANIQQGWLVLREFLGRFAPVGRAMQTVLGAVGLERLSVVAGSVIVALVLLWRFTRPKRKVGHAGVRS